MKALDIDSSLGARKELGCAGDTNDSATKRPAGCGPFFIPPDP
jgi:hypothetical protein